MDRDMLQAHRSRETTWSVRKRKCFLSVALPWKREAPALR
jgi:hypothetical protein